LAGCYCFYYPFVAELYHTKIRTSGIGFAETIGGFGSILMTVVVMSLYHISPYLPYLIFGGFCVIACICTLALGRDTTNQQLDQADEEEEE